MSNFSSKLQANSIYGALRGLEVRMLNEHGLFMTLGFICSLITKSLLKPFSADNESVMYF